MPTAPSTLTSDEQSRLLAVTSQGEAHLRDHMLLAVALGTGLRLHEILALNVGDVARDGKPRSRVRLEGGPQESTRAPICAIRKMRCVSLTAACRMRHNLLPLAGFPSR